MNDVTRFFGQRIGQGRSTRLGRDWQSVVNKTERNARDAVRKYAFAGDTTRADLVMSRVFIFHYFMTRQSNYYVQAMARHPALINAYFNIKERLEQANVEWPDYLEGWVKLMISPFGQQIFVNPFSMASSYLVFNDPGFMGRQEDMTTSGYWLKKVDDVIGINPVLMTSANILGFFGDDYAPDPLFIWQQMGLLNTAINFGRAHGYLGDDPTPIGNWYEQLNLNTREILSGWNPFADTVEATSSEARMDREINILIVDEAQRDGIDPETPEGQAIIRDAMTDPDSELYQRAVKRWVNGEAVDIATRFLVGPLRPRSRPINEEGQDLWSSFGQEIKNIVNVSDPRAIALREQEGGYYAIGEGRDQEIAALWNQVAFGDVHHPVTVDGVEYSPAEVYRMNTDQRIALANGLLEEHGLLDDYQQLQDERDRFLADPENAEYAQFRQWSKAVRDYPGGVDAYWQDAIKENPAAAEYYASVEAQTLLPWERERRLTNMAAFFGLTGVQPTVWDPVPAHTSTLGGIYDPANVANNAPEPTPYEEPNAEYRDEVRQAPVVLAEMQRWDNQVRQIQAEMGIDPAIPFNELDRDTRVIIEETLEEQGIYEPDVPKPVQDYIDWAAQQPQGADTSVEAYFAWSDEQYRRRAPQRATEAMTTPQAIPGPDRQGQTPPAPTSPSLWQDILTLLNTHDHSRYPSAAGGSNSNGSSAAGNWIIPYLD